MSPGEVGEFLSGQRWVVLGTLDADGGPWAELAPCALEAGELYFRVGRGSRAHANLRRDPRVCCAADAFPSYYEIRGVTAHGTARRVDDPRLQDRLRARLTDPGVPVADPAGEDSELFSLPLDDVFSFDFAKIRNQF